MTPITFHDYSPSEIEEKWKSILKHNGWWRLECECGKYDEQIGQYQLDMESDTVGNHRYIHSQDNCGGIIIIREWHTTLPDGTSPYEELDAY